MKASEDRSKGSKGPEEWKPSDAGYCCQYAIDWITIRNAWELTANEEEASSLAGMLMICDPALTLTVMVGSPRTPDTTTEDTENSQISYESCEVAEAAGESRVMGSSGRGRGFPHKKVPGARDGDGDGVVCEG